MGEKVKITLVAARKHGCIHMDREKMARDPPGAWPNCGFRVRSCRHGGIRHPPPNMGVCKCVGKKWPGILLVAAAKHRCTQTHPKKLAGILLAHGQIVGFAFLPTWIPLVADAKHGNVHFGQGVDIALDLADMHRITGSRS